MSEVKFCENNFSQGTDETAERIQNELDDVAVLVEPCLGHCGDCAIGPFALVNDKFIQADTADELYVKIVEQLE
ncbi:MAG: YuzB family protein [Clostridia bacterium]